MSMAVPLMAKGYKDAAEKPQGDRENLARLLEHADILTGIEVVGPENCPVAEAQHGKSYDLSAVPELPLPGCTRQPWCVCCYVGNPKGF